MDDLPDTQTPQVVLTATPQEIKTPWGKLNSCISYLKSVDLLNPVIKLGRSPDCDIVMSESHFIDPGRVVNFRPKQFLDIVSKQHFLISKEPGQPAYITDLSKNGTYLNSRLIGKNNTNILQNKDTISVGIKTHTAYTFQLIENEFDSFLPTALRSKYQVTSMVGKGACGEVRCAYEKVTCQKYAVKKITKGRYSNINLLNHPNKILTEIKILESLSHPCIIKMKEIVETDKEVFIVLDYMEGGELTNRILSMEPLSESTIKFLFYQMLLAVQYLHSQGISHRDLKPQNILLETNETECLIKLTDFGLSKIMDSDGLMETVCGTPHYVAPEILDNSYSVYDEKVDVWSLGVILYYMLCKELPFNSYDKKRLQQLILKGEYQLNGIAWQGVSYLAKDLVRRMLVKDPKKRFTVDRVICHPWISKDVSVKYKVNQLLSYATDTFLSDLSSFETPPPKRMRKE